MTNNGSRKCYCFVWWFVLKENFQKYFGFHCQNTSLVKVLTWRITSGAVASAHSTATFQSSPANLRAKNSFLSSFFSLAAVNNMGFADSEAAPVAEADASTDQSNVAILSSTSIVARTLPDCRTSVSNVSVEPWCKRGSFVVRSCPSMYTVPGKSQEEITVKLFVTPVTLLLRHVSKQTQRTTVEHVQVRSPSKEHFSSLTFSWAQPNQVVNPEWKPSDSYLESWWRAYPAAGEIQPWSRTGRERSRPRSLLVLPLSPEAQTHWREFLVDGAPQHSPGR